MVKVAVIVGSLRKDSINRKLAMALSQLALNHIQFSICDITDIPLYNQDLETAMPKSVTCLKQTIKDADAVLWVSPEYNRSLPGVVKNIIDWGTRPAGQSVWTGKFMTIIGTSPGAIGTAVAQSHFRSIMVALGATIMGQPEVYLVYKEGLIDDQEQITDDKTREFLQKFIERFADGVAKHHQSSS